MSGSWQTSVPDYNRARQGTLPGIIDQAIENALNNLEVMLPASVISYDRVNNVAAVQPNIMMVTNTGERLSRAPLASVPVLALGGGGYVINFPLPAGSQGWIKASDRDISLYLQSSQESSPNTQRLHSFSDGLFIPDTRNGFTISSEDSNNAVIQNLSGSVRLTLWADRIKMTAPTTIVNGNLQVTGSVIAGYGGGDQVGLQSHDHGNVQSGSAVTSAPIAGT